MMTIEPSGKQKRTGLAAMPGPCALLRSDSLILLNQLCPLVERGM